MQFLSATDAGEESVRRRGIINDEEDVSSARANDVRCCPDHELMSHRRSKHKFEMQVSEIIARCLDS